MGNCRGWKTQSGGAVPASRRPAAGEKRKKWGKKRGEETRNRGNSVAERATTRVTVRENSRTFRHSRSRASKFNSSPKKRLDREISSAEETG